MADHEHAHGAGAMDTDVDSAYVRVGTSWAGSGPGSQRQFGTHTVPRVGTNVLIAYENGDPDRPIIIDQLFNHYATPPALSNKGGLPGNRFQSGIRSREIGGSRGNQLRFDDTPGQISAQLASEHGHSELNLGWCTEPRTNGTAKSRGEGAELRSDNYVSIRGGQGVLISATERLRANGHQLERESLTSLAEVLASVQRQLAELASIHQAGEVDAESFKQLKGNLNNWESAGGTKNQAVGNPSQPIIAVDAPAGLLIGSGASVAIGAKEDVDVVSVGNTQLSTGRKLLMHAMEGISVFAHRLGIKMVAGGGKFEIQAHDENIELTSTKRIVLTASDEVVIQAPRVTIISQGAQVTFGGGAISNKCTGAFSVNSANALFAGPGDGNPQSAKEFSSATAHDQRVRMVDLHTREPLANQRYRATMEDGQVFEGVTDADGLTQILKSTIPFGTYRFEALYD